MRDGWDGVHERRDNLVLLSIPPRYNCTCGQAHTGAEFAELRRDAELEKWAKRVGGYVEPREEGPLG